MASYYGEHFQEYTAETPYVGRGVFAWSVFCDFRRGVDWRARYICGGCAAREMAPVEGEAKVRQEDAGTFDKDVLGLDVAVADLG